MMMQYGVNNGNENDKELVLCHDLELKYQHIYYKRRIKYRKQKWNAAN